MTATTLQRIASRGMRWAMVLALTTAVTSAATRAQAEGVAEIRAALAARQFDAAVSHADGYLATNPADADLAQYLKASALFHAEKFDAAAEAAEVVVTKHPQSPWVRKARFLKAQSLIRLRQFEAAEAVYAEEATRLLSGARKHDIAQLIIRFADALATEPDPTDVGAPPPNFQKAYNLYGKALEMEIDRGLRDAVMYKRAFVIAKAENHQQAVNDFHAYLDEFDPDWTGPVGSVERMQGRKKENPPAAGKHIFESRYRLGKSLLALNQFEAARVNWQDLHVMLLATPAAGRPAEVTAMIGDTAWQIVRSYNMPNVGRGELDRAIKAANDFLAAHRSHPFSVEAAWLIGPTLEAHGRMDEAAAAYEAFIAGTNYALPEGEAASKPLERHGKSPTQLADEWQKAAVYQIGEIRFAQKQYAQAIEQWQRYVNRFPNGPHWAQSQRRVIDAQFMMSIDAVSDGKYEEARGLFAAFLKANPLDDRARQVVFALGQMQYAEAEKLEKQSAAADKVREAYQKTIDEWQRLVSKYPQTEESSLALFRVGLIQETKLRDLEAALDSYRRLTWGSWAGEAQQRVAMMTQKALTLTTERTYRGHEPAKVKLNVRNIEKLTVRQYRLDIEAYFRKTHGTGGVEELDISLIEPDKTWEVKIDGYAKYKPIEQEVEVPFEAGKGGVCIVHVSDEDYEATTLVVRSDIDLVAKSSRREALVFIADRVTGKPAEGVELLVSDGAKVVATGKTGADGVWRGKPAELKDMSTVRVLALRNGHVASNVLSLQNLGLSTGLARKGYIYTDRSAYQPGHTVNARGIIREVVDGSYAVPADKAYLVSITDSQGRVLREQEVALSAFGSFDVSMRLDDSASVGQYTITARRKADETVAYSGQFLVQTFQLEKMRVKIEFPRNVYFRGEQVEATLTAEYYWGEPVAGKPVRYHLPDGRSYVAMTDKAGQIKVTFDTTGLNAPMTLGFHGVLEGENVSGSAVVSLVKDGFAIEVTPSAKLVIAGEPFDVKVKTTAPDGKPIGQALTLTVLRQQTPQPDPVLDAIPWISRPQRASAAVTVKTEKLTTDAQTGLATVRLTLEAGGQYTLRAAGVDRFEQTITAQNDVTISGDDDATKLRFFSDSDTLQVGGEATVRLHSRVESGLALLTFEGEQIIEHRVVPIKLGYNDIKVAVGHEHFPNFRVASVVMDGRELREASKDLKVQRQLKVTIAPGRPAYLPGAEATVEITVTDQLGKPVVAELSLAAVDEALFALYPDATPSILDFFQADAKRHAEFRVGSSAGFRYDGVTRKVIKAVVEEQQRLEREELAERELKQVADQLRSLSRAPQAPAPAAAPRPAPNATAGFGAPADAAQVEAGGAGGAAPGGRPAARGRLDDAAARKSADGLALFAGADRRNVEKAKGDAQGGDEARVELPDAGVWLPAVVTDAQGKATVKFNMPDTTTQWRLTSRGVSQQTLVGEATANVLTRKDFFVEVKAPRSLQEGDHVSVITRVHNLTDFAGPVDLTLTVSSNGRKYYELHHKAQVEKGGTVETMFDSIEVPKALSVTMTVTAAAGGHADALAREATVRPWGVEYADHGGGTSTTDASVTLALPAGMEYASRWLTVSIGPSLNQQVIDLAMGPVYYPLVKADGHRIILPPQYGSFAGSELLAAVSGLQYAQAAGRQPKEYQQLFERARTLVSTLVVTQRGDGGWGWLSTTHDSDWAVTATSYWALTRAQQAGVKVDANAMEKARTFLNNIFQRVDATDDNAKAVILHALSTSNHADFAHVNRLYRQRQSLSNAALAYTALAFVNFQRNEIAGEMLDVLDAKATDVPPPPGGAPGARSLAMWKGVPGHPWLNDDVETTAAALLAMVKVRPQSPKAAQAAQWLLNVRGCFGFHPAKSRGPAVAALAAWFGTGKFADSDAQIAVTVNGKPLTTLATKGAPSTVLLPVPAEMLVDGRNLVKFDVNGRAEYAYAATLRGFSAQMKDPESWKEPYVKSRKYQHATLEYRGNPIGAASTSPVENMAIGQRTRVTVDLEERSLLNSYLIIEESLPAGTKLVPDSLKGNFKHHEITDSKITLFYPPNHQVGDYTYELVGYSPGHYRVLPTVMRDAMNPGRMRLGAPGSLKVLGPGADSPDAYVMNNAERFALGKAYFDDGLYQQAHKYLSELFKLQRNYNERDTARMLLWIHTTEGFYDAQRIVEMFEVLRERYPELFIPFDRILTVARAYHDLGEFERAYLVYRATIDASFINDSNVSATLQDEGQLLGSIDYQQDLWRQYPDTPDVTASHFALSQLLYQQAPNAHNLAKAERRIDLFGEGGKKPDAERKPVTKADMLKRAIQMLDDFLTLYPTNPLTDDAAFSMANAFLELKDYGSVVTLSERFRVRYPKSDFVSGFQYMEALGHFWKRDYEPALGAAKVVADGESKDRDFARYILGQIHHAQGKPELAIQWYDTVKDKYPDAKQAIDYFKDKRIAIEEVTIVRPGQPVELKIDYRNIPAANLQVYRVDLMKLYLQEKNLSSITKVNLAGIAPQLVADVPLGDGKDYADKNKVASLNLKDEGAYLVICRGEDLFTSGLVLITPLKIEVQEDAVSGRVRANVVNAVTGARPAEVHVKAIGSADEQFRGGDTDLRGLFVADGLNGKVTVIARDADSRYAFYRGEQWLGAQPGQQPARPAPQQQMQQLQADDYSGNLRMLNEDLQNRNWTEFDKQRRGPSKGVQIQQAK